MNEGLKVNYSIDKGNIMNKEWQQQNDLKRKGIKRKFVMEPMSRFPNSSINMMTH